MGQYGHTCVVVQISFAIFGSSGKQPQYRMAMIKQTPDVSHTKRMTPRDHVVSEAINPYTSKYGETITEKNPHEDKELFKRIQRIKAEKKKKEQNHFWQQRRFFIDKAFDDQQELRFTKLRDKIQQDLSDVDTHLVNKYAGTRPSSGYLSFDAGPSPQKHTDLPDRRKLSLTQKIFPVREGNVKKGINFLRLQQKHDELNTVRQSQSRESRKSSLSDSSQMITGTGYPILLPIRTEGRKCRGRNIHRKTNNPLKEICKADVSTDMCNKQLTRKKHNGGRVPSSGGDKPVTGVIDSVALANENEYNRNVRHARGKLNMISQSSIDPEKDHHIVKTNNQSRETSTENFQNEAKTATETSLYQKQQLLTDKRVEKLTSDELLIKLTKSLPMHMLIKTDETLNDLSTALGYSERNKILLERERTLSAKLGVGDERYRKLESVLTRKPDIR